MSQQINLFSPIFLRQKKHFSAIPMLQGLALVVMAMLGFYIYAHHQISLLAQQSDELVKRTTAMQNKLEKSGAGISSAKKASDVSEQIKMAETELKQRQELIAGLGGGQAGNVEGYSVFMKALARQNINGLWLTGFNVNEAGSEMKISGRALDAGLVPVFIRELNQEPFMRGRNFEYLQIRSAQVVEAENRAQAPEETASPVTGGGITGLLSKLLPGQAPPVKQSDLTIDSVLKGSPVAEKSKVTPVAIQRPYLEFELSTRAPEDAGGGKPK